MSCEVYDYLRQSSSKQLDLCGSPFSLLCKTEEEMVWEFTYIYICSTRKDVLSGMLCCVSIAGVLYVAGPHSN